MAKKRILKVCAKCSDMCSLRFEVDGKAVATSDSYVPSGIGIGEFYGDYVEMDIDVETGMIIGFPKKLTDAAIIKAIKKA